MALILLVLFIAVPIAELYVIIQVGQAIGVWPTIAILILDGFLGAALARSQGRAAWARFNRALAEGRVPARETFHGAMIILGGALLLAPGFITDIVGLMLLIPFTRALIAGGVARLARRRISFGWTVLGSPPDPRGPRPGPGGFGPGPSPRPSRSYDYEGTARDVSEPSEELPEARRDG